MVSPLGLNAARPVVSRPDILKSGVAVATGRNSIRNKARGRNRPGGTQGLGAGRSAATTRALEAKGRLRSPTIVVSDLCDVISHMGHSSRHGVVVEQTSERLIIMGKANSGMDVGVGPLNEIRAFLAHSGEKKSL
jgi:hypothetical protein